MRKQFKPIFLLLPAITISVLAGCESPQNYQLAYGDIYFVRPWDKIGCELNRRFKSSLHDGKLSEVGGVALAKAAGRKAANLSYPPHEIPMFA